MNNNSTKRLSWVVNPIVWEMVYSIQYQKRGNLGKCSHKQFSTTLHFFIYSRKDNFRVGGVLEAADCLFCSRSGCDAADTVIAPWSSMAVFRSFCPSQTAPLGAPPGPGGTRQSDCGPTALSPSKRPRSAGNSFWIDSDWIGMFGWVEEKRWMQQ